MAREARLASVGDPFPFFKELMYSSSNVIHLQQTIIIIDNTNKR